MATTRISDARTYADKRDFTRTPEPEGGRARAGKTKARTPIFVVQKHAASRLHWDFRLEHAGVLWSWAVPKGPSMDRADKRLAVHVEDHPLEYAGFEGTIPAGNYGAGSVEIWDSGTWEPLGDAAAGLAAGEIKFRLSGTRLTGTFVLVRIKARRGEHAENWLLIKERDDAVRQIAVRQTAVRKKKAAAVASGDVLPVGVRPALATLVEEAPRGAGWVSEIKYDGYRLLVRKEGDEVALFTRSGLDWTHRLKRVAASLLSIPAGNALLDGELVALAPDGTTSFSALQEALSAGRDDTLLFYAFDLLHCDGEDLRPRGLLERKRRLEALCAPTKGKPGVIRFSEHLTEDAARIRTEVCRLGLEGIVCKRVDAPYREGRTRDWVKVKCDTRDEMVVLGWTRPKGARQGLGALHLGYHDAAGALHYAGGCGSGFSDVVLGDLTRRLAALKGARPKGLVAGEDPPRGLAWVRPELVVEVKHAGLTGSGMLRHARFLGLRDDKPASEVVRAGPADAPAPPPEPETPPRAPETSLREPGSVKKRVARDGAIELGGVRISHPDRDLWPGITKRDLAAYWEAVAGHALPGIAHRPLALLRCPDGVSGESFFQKHLKRGFPRGVTEGVCDEAPYLAIEDQAALTALVQMSTIEIHSWGSSLDAPDRADRLVFDLDPDPSVGFDAVVKAAKDLRRALEALGFTAFVRTTGGKGLHVLVPVATGASWDEVRAWCRAFATGFETREPRRFIASTTRKEARRGRILIDWLRNGRGSTAVASFSPRARPGAPVATPLAWREVIPALDPASFDVRTVPARLARQKRDPWDGFAEAAIRALPVLKGGPNFGDG